MCISDWRLGRLIRSQTTSAALTVGQTLILPPNAQRVGVILSNSIGTLGSANSATVAIGGVNCFLICGALPPLSLTLKDYGDLITKQIVLTCGTTAATIFATELFLPESVLSEAIETDMRKY
jgi:hypothetical protein